MEGILETLSSLVSVDEITSLLTTIAEKVPDLTEIINTIIGLLG